MSTAIFDALPGVETPVGDVRRALADVWEVEPTPGKPAPSEFRASQMNLVLHLGLDSTVESARQAFDTAMRFSSRYPCRTVVLCPRAPGRGGDVAAKIFCECFIGQSRHDMTCSEAIILTYPLEQRRYLEDQMSIMLESDLPLYYWPQHINSVGRLGDYKFLLKEAHRVVIDTAVERTEVAAYVWPRPQVVHDLVHARVLPVRQSVGHFLSYVSPRQLASGLRRVEMRHRPAYAAEARALLTWARRGVEDCAAQAGLGKIEAAFERREDAALAGSIASEWTYAEGGRLSFAFDFERAAARLESSLGIERNAVSASVRLLPTENALAEALFF